VHTHAFASSCIEDSKANTTNFLAAFHSNLLTQASLMRYTSEQNVLVHPHAFAQAELKTHYQKLSTALQLATALRPSK
jgi:hypothetical protein